MIVVKAQLATSAAPVTKNSDNSSTLRGENVSTLSPSRANRPCSRATNTGKFDRARPWVILNRFTRQLLRRICRKETSLRLGCNRSITALAPLEEYGPQE